MGKNEKRYTVERVLEMNMKDELKAVEKELIEKKEQIDLNARNKHYESSEDLCNDIHEYVQTANELAAVRWLINLTEAE